MIHNFGWLLAVGEAAGGDKTAAPKAPMSVTIDNLATSLGFYILCALSLIWLNLNILGRTNIKVPGDVDKLM